MDADRYGAHAAGERMKRLALLDTIALRSTSVYRNPRDISYLQIVYGDLSGSKIPCTPIDKDGIVYHASDIPMQIITQVQREGSPIDSGFVAYRSRQDETGMAIACVVFDNPQYDAKISISGKGAIKLDTGELIENPADHISDLLLNVQGYEPDSIDTAELARFYSDCLTQGIRTATIINNGQKTIKEHLDELAANIHAQWLISDGKAVMRLKWL